MTVVTPIPTPRVAGIQDGATVLIGGFGTAGQPVELIDALLRTAPATSPWSTTTPATATIGLAALLAAGPGPQDHLLVPAADRLLGLRRALPRRQDRARGGAAGQPRRADARGRGRHRRVLHPDRRRHAAGRGQGGSARIDGRDYVLEYPLTRRRRADQGAHRRHRWATSSTARPPATSARSWRPPRPPRSSQVDHGRRGRRPRPRGRRHARHLRRPGRRPRPPPRRSSPHEHDRRHRRAPTAGRSSRDELAERGRPRHRRRLLRQPRHRPAHHGRRPPRRPTPGSSCTPRTACSAWARRPPATRSTPT